MDNMMTYVENHMEYTKKILKFNPQVCLIQDKYIEAGYKKNFNFIQQQQCKVESNKNMYDSNRNVKYLGILLTEYLKGLYTEN